MRRTLLAVALAGALASPLGALAAPTCQTRDGDTIRCATPGAMPVGWRLSWRELTDKELAKLTPATLRNVLGVVLTVGAFMALIALMPDFQQGWDEQEKDRQEKA